MLYEFITLNRDGNHHAVSSESRDEVDSAPQ